MRCLRRLPWYSFAVVFLISLSLFGQFFAYDSPGSLGTWLMDDWGLTAVDLGLFNTLFAIPNIFAACFFGILIDRTGSASIPGIFITFMNALGPFVFAAGAPNKTWMMIGRFILGLGGDALCSVQSRLVVQWIPIPLVSIILGLTFAVNGLGTVAVQNLLPLMVKATSLNTGFWIAFAFVGMGLITAIISFILSRLRDPPPGTLDQAIAQAEQETEINKEQEAATENPTKEEPHADDDATATTTTTTAAGADEESLPDAGLPHTNSMATVPCPSPGPSPDASPALDMPSPEDPEVGMPVGPLPNPLELDLVVPDSPRDGEELAGAADKAELGKATVASMDGTATPAPSRRERMIKFIKSLRFTVAYWLVIGYASCSMGIHYTVNAFLPDLIAEKWGMPLPNAASITSLISAVSLCVAPFIGFFIDRWGKRIIWGASFSAATALTFVLLATTKLTPYVHVITQGLFLASAMIVMNSSIPLVVDKDTLGTAYGLSSGAQNIVLAISATIAGALRNATGTYTYTLLWYAGLSLAASVCQLLLIPIDARHQWILQRKAQPVQEAREHTERVDEERKEAKQRELKQLPPSSGRSKVDPPVALVASVSDAFPRAISSHAFRLAEAGQRRRSTIHGPRPVSLSDLTVLPAPS